MQPTSAQDYKKLLTEVIKKQIVILGPDITLSKARNVKGLTVADDGTVTDVDSHPQEVTQALIDQFVQLSGLIVKKTMEPLLTLSQPQTPTPPTQPTEPTPPSQQPSQPVAPAAPAAQTTTQTVSQPTASPTQTPAQTTSPTPTPQTPADPQNANPVPTSNPLAA